MVRVSLLFFVLALAAFGQNNQIGGFAGTGGAIKLFETSAYHFVAGVEGCVRCGGRLGIFGEYHHWKKFGSGTDQPVSLDLAGGGLRIQGKGRRVRPFFDAGLLAGAERTRDPFPSSPFASHSVIGGMVGLGAAISVSERWYVRPLIRMCGLSSSEGAGFWAVSAGYRF